MLMPTASSALRRVLDLWFDREQVMPRVMAEIEDRALMRALMKDFGEAGAGVFTAPHAVDEDVLSKDGVEVVGRVNDVKERFYAISAARRIKHPAVSMITERVRAGIFSQTHLAGLPVCAMPLGVGGAGSCGGRRVRRFGLPATRPLSDGLESRAP